ncbi:YcbX family protein [Utexia brackfieldae]|uniref:YcbX family protein n=1 Tax=Utexia brackfieldae TaxID=3074108 RepID=UPI00370DA222
MMRTIEQLFIYPAKSLSGIRLDSAQVQPSGFQFDRQFMLTKPDGTFITARKYPKLLRLTPQITDAGLTIISPDNRSIVINYRDFSSQPEFTEVWGNHFHAYIASINVNRWFSDYLQHDVQLRWVGEHSSRRIKQFPDIPLSFADGYPFLLINRASFEYVKARCHSPIEIAQFRANIIVDDQQPFAEDSWKTIKIGEVIFELVKPCSRCILTTVDTLSAKLNSQKEPLSVLAEFRTDDKGDIDFGMNMIARNQGLIRVTDRVEILETKPAKLYQQRQYTLPSFRASAEPSATTHQEIDIDYQGQFFKGNTEQTILEQLEQHNIQIPYSCRAGLCGRCHVALIEGEVKPLVQNAIRQQHQILACSCIPRSNIKLG